MKKSSWLIAAATLPLMAGGCGGSSSNSADTSPPSTTATQPPPPITAATTTRATLQKSYEIYTFSTSDVVPQYTYADVVYPAGLANIFAQGSISVDLQKDGYPEAIIPLNKAYGTPAYAAMPYIYLSNTTGKLTYDPQQNASLPSVYGARRAVSLLVNNEPAAFFTAHNVSGVYADPKAYGTAVLLMDVNGSPKVRDELIPRLTTSSELSDHGTDAHAMATGDINGDKRDDLVIGNWRPYGGFPPIFLTQNADGSFTVQQSAFLEKLVSVPMLNPNSSGNQGQNLWTDVHLADVNRDGFDDLIAGFGHGSTHSLLFYNRNGTFSFDDRIDLPASIYGTDTDLHMETRSVDMDNDGDLDLILTHTRYQPYYGGDYIQLLRNDAGKFTDISKGLEQPELDVYAGRLQWSSDLYVRDVNHDGWQDIIFGRSDGTLRLFLNIDGQQFKRLEAPLPASSGGGRLVGVADYDKDGAFEYIYYQYGGTATTNTYYLNLYELSLL